MYNEEEYFKYTNQQKLKTKQMDTIKSTLSLQQELPEADKNSLYFIDWGKVTNVNDLMVIIASMGISFSPYHPAWERIKGFVDYTNPMPVPNQPQQQKVEEKEFKLPKLKTIK